MRKERSLFASPCVTCATDTAPWSGSPPRGAGPPRARPPRKLPPAPPSAAPWAPLGRGEHHRTSRASALASDHPESGHPGDRTRRRSLVSWVWGVVGQGPGSRGRAEGSGEASDPGEKV